MLADFKVVLDACVLANFAVCDLFLHLAEAPRLYLPRWSTAILDEVRNVQLTKLRRPWPQKLADSWRGAVTTEFPEALVDDYEHLIEHLQNDPGDRHVLAVSIRSGASVIVTFNLKHFPKEALQPWGIEACHPQDYLLTLYSMAPEIIVSKLHDIAHRRGQDLLDVLMHLGRAVPEFSSHLIDELELNG